MGDLRIEYKNIVIVYSYSSTGLKLLLGSEGQLTLKCDRKGNGGKRWRIQDFVKGVGVVVE